MRPKVKVYFEPDGINDDTLTFDYPIHHVNTSDQKVMDVIKAMIEIFRTDWVRFEVYGVSGHVIRGSYNNRVEGI